MGSKCGLGVSVAEQERVAISIRSRGKIKLRKVIADDTMFVLSGSERIQWSMLCLRLQRPSRVVRKFKVRWTGSSPASSPRTSPSLCCFGICVLAADPTAPCQPCLCARDFSVSLTTSSIRLERRTDSLPCGWQLQESAVASTHIGQGHLARKWRTAQIEISCHCGLELWTGEKGGSRCHACPIPNQTHRHNLQNLSATIPCDMRAKSTLHPEAASGSRRDTHPHCKCWSS